MLKIDRGSTVRMSTGIHPNMEQQCRRKTEPPPYYVQEKIKSLLISKDLNLEVRMEVKHVIPTTRLFWQNEERRRSLLID